MICFSAGFMKRLGVFRINLLKINFFSGSRVSPDHRNLKDSLEMVHHLSSAASAPPSSGVSTMAGHGEMPSGGLLPRAQERDKRKLLLLVEDNRADVFLVEQAIEFYKVPVRLMVAEDGELACRYLDRLDADRDLPFPAILLLDLNLPRKSGSEVLKRLRRSSRCPKTPVVVLTSSDAEEDRENAAQLGARRYLKKAESYRECLQIGAVLNDLLRESNEPPS
jgi:CheY-like chemotaxis protein